MMLAALQTLPVPHLDLESALASELYHLYVSNLFQTACYALFCYDHLLVFSDEVHKIWKKPFTLPSLLYILHRYITHAGFILMQLALHERGWASEICTRFVQIPGAFIIVTFTLTAATLILRMYAMYLKNNILLSCLSLVLIGQIIIMGVCLSTVFPYPLLDGCILTSAASYFGAFWAAPLGMDAIFLALSLYRVYNYRQFRIRSTLAEQLLRDGVPYLIGVFCAKLLCVVAFFTAPDDLRELGASFALALSSLLVARLQLSLDNREPEAENILRLFFTANQEGDEDGNGLLARFFTLGNLGEQIPLEGYACVEPVFDTVTALEQGVKEHKYHYRRRTVPADWNFDPLPPSLGKGPRSPV